MGHKVSARNLMATPASRFPGTREPVHDVDGARRAAQEVGFPLMVKAPPAAAASG